MSACPDPTAQTRGRPFSVTPKGFGNSWRDGAILSNGFNLIWAVQLGFTKNSGFRLTQITFKTPPSYPSEGRIAIVTDVGMDAVDAAASSRVGIAGRVYARERSTGAWTNGAETPLLKCGRQHMADRGLVEVAADGKTVWFWRPLLVLNRRRSGRPNRARHGLNPPVTVTRRIRRREEHGISR
jgi:hypothetical protein